MSKTPHTPPSEAGTAPEAQPVSAQPASTIPPDRLAINPRSPHFDAEVLGRGVGIRFKGVVRTDVEEYCISEGWVRVQAGRSRDRNGNPLTIKLNGSVEAWFEGLDKETPVSKPPRQ